MTRETHHRPQSKSAGFTLLELMIVVAIIAIIATIGVPIYQRTKANAENMNACAELKSISTAIDRFILINGYPPDSLSEVDMDDMRDAWGNPYEYLRLDTIGGDKKGNKGGLGKARKDRNLVPINSDYDLFSKGPDGKSASPLTAKSSQDDLIRAQNGDYFGVAANY